MTDINIVCCPKCGCFHDIHIFENGVVEGLYPELAGIKPCYGCPDCRTVWGEVTPKQIIRAILSNATQICNIYGFDLKIDDSYIPTDDEISVKLTVKKG